MKQMTGIMLVQRFLEILYPKGFKCLSCSKEVSGYEIQYGFCSSCLQSFKWIIGDSSRNHWLIGERYFELGFSAILYDGLIKDLIYRLKYFGERSLVYPLVEIMCKQFPRKLQKVRWDGLIPVPMHTSRLQERGYNQAALLAQGLAFYLKSSCYDWVVRVKETVPQNKLKLEDRLKNLEGVFAVKDTNQVKGGRWLIIDDILTTGSTVNQVAKVLKLEGAEMVGVYTLTSGSTDVYL